ncbi:MAG: antibiotic biosynthesis monooxygenase [Rhodobacteraceae bacterium]|nr:antibiotic biosynthesis monooxygenase [Paracoccaceae bacterium]
MIELSISAGHEKEIEKLLNGMATVIQAQETGTEVWSWSRSEDGKTVSVHERYSDENAVMTHLTNFGEFADRFLAALTPKRFIVLADPSSKLREALAGFGPTYFVPKGGFAR